MPLSEDQKKNCRHQIINRLNEIYEMTAQEALKLRDNKLNELDQAAQVQLDYDSRVSKDPLTIKEILELEKNGTTTVD